jgi:hypothetical protein
MHDIKDDAYGLRPRASARAWNWSADCENMFDADHIKNESVSLHVNSSVEQHPRS